MLEQGRYNAKMTDAAWMESRNGNVYMLARFTVTQGGRTGYTVTKQLHFTDAALERTLDDLRTCGYEGADPLEISGEMTTAHCPAEVSIVVEHEDYNDDKGEAKRSAKVKWINSLERVNKPLETTVSTGTMHRFGTDLKARIAGLNAKAKASGTGGVKVNGSRPKPPPSREPAPQECGGVDDDSIPF